MKLPAPGIDDLKWVAGRLHYCGIPLDELARQTGTPSFLFSQARLESNLDRISKVFSPPPPWRLRIGYSVKTAWEPGLLRLLAQKGAEAEVACRHELELCLRAGFSPGSIVLDGPAHTEDALTRAVECGIRQIKVDSLDQLRLLAGLLKDTQRQGVGLRIKAPGSGIIRRPTDVLEGRFGMDAEELDQAFDLLKNHPGMVFCGLGVHIGSQVTDPALYKKAMQALGRCYARAAGRGLSGTEVNIGGGFPSATLGPPTVWGLLKGLVFDTNGDVPALEQFGRMVCGKLSAGGLPPGVSELTVEPGRSLIGDAAVLLCRVVAKKKGWLVLDASRNFVPESLLFATRKFMPAGPRRGLPWKRTSLSGSTLSGGDVLTMNARLPDCEQGDLLVMMDAGAYTLSRANRFTTLLPPAWLLDSDNQLQPLHRRETAEDVVRESDTW